MEKERILVTSPHPSMVIIPALVAATFFPLFAITDSVLIGSLSLLPLVSSFVTKKTTRYSINEKFILIESGIILKRINEIPIRKINEVEVSQSLVQRFFKTGDVLIRTGNDSEIIIRNILGLNEFKEAIYNKMLNN